MWSVTWRSTNTIAASFVWVVLRSTRSKVREERFCNAVIFFFVNSFFLGIFFLL